MKKILLITLALFGSGLSVNAQTIVSGSRSSSSYFICPSDISMSWGLNNKGQLGDGTITSRDEAVQVSGLSGVTAVSAGFWHSIFLKSDGTVWVSGYNSDGQLGDGTNTDSHTPIQVSGLSGIISVAAGGNHSLFLKNDGTVWSTGKNTNGQLGDDTYIKKNIPVQVIGLSGITAIAAGGDHSLFLKNDGTVWACGMGFHGQLGLGSHGTSASRKLAAQVATVTGITAIAAGNEFSLYLKNDGSAWACGNNGSGTLGDGTTNDRDKPVQVSMVSDITAITAGGNHALYLKNDGSVWACGDNYYGQLGDGTTTVRHSPVQLSGLSDIIAIAGGSEHTLLMKNDNSIWACGSNYSGQLGDGTNTDRLNPVQIDAHCGSAGIEEANQRFSSLSVYPNPAKNSIIIRIESDSWNGKQAVKIFNALGQEILQTSPDSYWNHGQLSIDISSLSSGLYFIGLFDGENRGQVKFVKE